MTQSGSKRKADANASVSTQEKAPQGPHPHLFMTVTTRFKEGAVIGKSVAFSCTAECKFHSTETWLQDTLPW